MIASMDSKSCHLIKPQELNEEEIEKLKVEKQKRGKGKHNRERNTEERDKGKENQACIQSDHKQLQ